MENRNVILLFLLGLLCFGCNGFKGEQVELNYKEGYVKVLSNDYVIDSLIISNHINKYYIIGLSDKGKGVNIIYFRKKNLNYRIYSDSLKYYCSKVPEVDLPALDVIIRKKGYLGKDENNDFKNIQYFSYNQIPCDSNLLDTIKANNPYK